ncbi:uncharacterized protein LOC133360044 isoform X2 [Lethenteron reissneri]|uniref:uncharacterized protein LOC133360044 isoform X2 n=1 Tax=Lethenteron reissneri TaxID=7753 RepID=UPI002AB74059|nr:uncharacterized protein LOC133360044 isoform X2 [Lethenteron reissneri]
MSHCRDTKALYHRRDWPQRTEFSVGTNNVKWEPLVDPQKGGGKTPEVVGQLRAAASSGHWALRGCRAAATATSGSSDIGQQRHRAAASSGQQRQRHRAAATAGSSDIGQQRAAGSSDIGQQRAAASSGQQRAATSGSSEHRAAASSGQQRATSGSSGQRARGAQRVQGSQGLIGTVSGGSAGLRGQGPSIESEGGILRGGGGQR